MHEIAQALEHAAQPTAKLESLLALAVRYLEHPDVTAIPFAVGSANVARRIREAVDIDAIERRRGR